MKISRSSARTLPGALARSLVAGAVCCCGAPEFAPAATTNLFPVADTTLSENYPSNNLGGLKFVNSGTTQNFTRNRGLFRFDVAGAIPPNSKIQSARLVLEVTGVPAEPNPPFADFGLHRVLRPWGEGDKTSPTNCTSCVGQGGLATTNEATWLTRFAFTTNAWAAPGAAATTDYLPEVSSSETIYGIGDSPYTFFGTPRLIADVQLWLDNPATNFGWLLLCQSESTPFTARRFGSREDPNFTPRLVIEYIPPPRIGHMEATGDQLRLHFSAEAGQPYVVQFRNSLSSSNDWSVLTNVPAQPVTTNLVVSDLLATPQRFYRVGFQ